MYQTRSIYAAEKRGRDFREAARRDRRGTRLGAPQLTGFGRDDERPPRPSSLYSFKSVRGNLDASEPSIHVELSMKSDLAALLAVVDELMLLVRKSGCVPGAERDVECALREALDNAVVHGNRGEAKKLVHIDCRCEPGKELLVAVRDEGEGFDVKDALNRGTRRDAKSGIPLMRLLMDEVHFEQAGREVRMRKRAGASTLGGRPRSIR